VLFALPTRLPLFGRGAFAEAASLVAPFAYASPQPLVLQATADDGLSNFGARAANEAGDGSSESSALGAWRLPDAAVAAADEGGGGGKSHKTKSSSSGGGVVASAAGPSHAAVVTESTCMAEARELVTWADGGPQAEAAGAQGPPNSSRRWPLRLVSPVCVAGDETLGPTMRLRHAGGGGGHKR
jgi:hypothetical protein